MSAAPSSIPAQSGPLATEAFELPDCPAGELAAQLLTGLGARVRLCGDGTEEPDAPRTGRLQLTTFGDRGRFAEAPRCDSAVAAIGGASMAQFTAEPGPAYLVTAFATIAQGALAAVSSVVALLVGSDAVPVSTLQGLFAVESGTFAFGSGGAGHRDGVSPRGPHPANTLYEAQDGWFVVVGSTLPAMLKVFQTFELDDVLNNPVLASGPTRAFADRAFNTSVRERIEAKLRTMSRDDAVAQLTASGVPAGPVLSLEEMLVHPQVSASECIEIPVRTTVHGGGAPRWQPSGEKQPLAGLRVVELTGYIAGPYACRLLADLGATVVKVEPPDGDPFRPYGYGFAAWNHSKRSRAIDLRQSGGRRALLDLIRDADVLVTNYRTESLERMGVGRDAMFVANPGLIHCTLTGYGDRGPLALKPGLDAVIQAFCGIMRIQGGDGDPVRSQINATDYLCGILGVLGVLSALVEQRRRGGGAAVTTSLLAAGLLCTFWVRGALQAGRPYLRGGRDFRGPHPLNRLHQTSDGWLLTAAPEPWQDARWTPGLAFLQAGLRTETVASAIARLAELQIPAVPCLAPRDLLGEPHFRDNDLWCTAVDRSLGEITFPRSIFGASGNVMPAPLCGVHDRLANVWLAQGDEPNG